MILVDVVVIIAIIGFVGNGWRAGAIESLGRLLGAIIGYVIAKSYAGWLVGLVGLFVPKTWAFLISFLIVFLIVDHIVGFLFHLADGALKIITWLPIIKQINGFIGGVFGLLEAAIVIGGISWLLTHAPSVNTDFLAHSVMLPYVNTLFNVVIAKVL